MSAVAFLFILALILPGLPVPQFGGGGESGGDIFETGAVESAAVEESAGGGDIFETSAVESVDVEESAVDESIPLPAPPPVPWGVHADALAPESYTANLEEGGVVISYNCPDGCDDLVGQLTAVVNEVAGGGSKVILVPNPNIASQLMLATSDLSETMDAFDEAAIRDFIQTNAATNP